MSIVHTVLARVFVNDIDQALPLYERLTEAEPRRFSYRDVELAWVGPFLLLQVSDEQRQNYERTATLLTTDIALAKQAIEQNGGQILDGPAGAPNGARMIAQHADGAIFEYIESIGH